MRPILIAAALTLWLTTPAFCSDSSAKAIIASSRADLAEQQAVLLDLCSEDLRFLVVAAKDKSLEGNVVYLKHILSNNNRGNEIYLYYKPGQQNAVFKLPSQTRVFSQEETMTLRSYYAPTIAYSTQARPMRTSVAQAKLKRKRGL